MNEKRRRLFSFINSLIHLWRRWKKNALGPTGRMIWPVGCSAGVPTTIEYHKLILDVQVGEQPPPVFRPRSKDRTNAPPPRLPPPLDLQDFRDGKVDTAFIPKHEEELAAVSVHLTHIAFSHF